MSVEATSNLSFGDLLLETARKMGVAFYGEQGDEQAQIPIDDHDLAECKRHVNNALRMFWTDAPVPGWKWAQPIMSLVLWPSVSVDATKTVTGGTPDLDLQQTLITANSSVFYESMEEKTLVVTGQGSMVIKQYVSATQAYVYGSHGFAAASTYSITADGDYTLPRSFAGAHSGDISFASSTNRGMQIELASELQIRKMRENVNVQTGIPRYIALDVFLATAGRRRYRLMAYPTPSEVFTVLLPADISFDQLDSASDFMPTPLMHDETLRAACLAIVEKDVKGVVNGPDMTYYKDKLTYSQQADARSRPRKLGYFGNQRPVVTPHNFREYMQRPNVTFNP